MLTIKSSNWLTSAWNPKLSVAILNCLRQGGNGNNVDTSCRLTVCVANDDGDDDSGTRMATMTMTVGTRMAMMINSHAREHVSRRVVAR
jgi:hypothetical protein